MYDYTVKLYGKIMKGISTPHKAYSLRIKGKARSEVEREKQKTYAYRKRFCDKCIATFALMDNVILSTLTYRKGKKTRNPDTVKKSVISLMNAINYKYPKSSYVIVTEESRKGYIHCHMLSRGVDFEFIKAKWEKENGYYLHKTVQEDLDSVIKLAYYLTKGKATGKLLQKYTYHLADPETVMKEERLYRTSKEDMENDLEAAGYIVTSTTYDYYGGIYTTGFLDET